MKREWIRRRESTCGVSDGPTLRLPPERVDDPEWTNLRLHDIRERWDPAIAPWVAAEHAARMNHALTVISGQAALPSRVLDVGCAQGTLGHLLSQEGYEVTLVDVRASHIAYARERSEVDRRMSYAVGLVPDVPSAGEFDVVTCTEVIEHMPAPKALLAGLREKCRVGGIVYLTTPNGSYVLSRLATYSTVSEEVLATMERNSDDGDDHRFAYTLTELVSIVRSAGFAVREAGVFLPCWVVGFAKTRSLHRLYFSVARRAVSYRPRPRRTSAFGKATCTSIYIVAERTA